VSTLRPEAQEHRSYQNVADLASRRASDQAWKQFAQAQTPEEFCSGWLVIQCHAIGGVSDGVVVLKKPGTSAFAPVAFYPDNAQRDRSQLAELSERALAEGRGVVQPREQPADSPARDPRYQLAYPVRVDGEVRGVVGVEIDWRPEAQLQSVMRDLQWGAGWLEVLLRRHADPKDSARTQLKLALDLVSTLLEQPGLKDGAAAFTTEMATRLGFDRVVLAVAKGRRVKLCAVSHSPQFEPRSNLLRAVESAMEEAIDQAATVVFPPPRENLPVVTHAHEALVRESGAGSAVTIPLTSGDRVIGALTLESPAGYRFDVPTLELCQAAAAVAGPVVELKRSSEEGLASHAAGSTAELWRRLVGPGFPGYKFAAVCVALVAAFLGFATGEFRISATSKLEGAVQRAIAAPFNGYIKEAPVRAGDEVKAGQVIGRFDDRDLQLERVKLLSQREQYAKQYREALAKHDRAQMEIVGAQVAQAEAQLAQVAEQLARVEMVAPLDGIVVSGDLSQSLGSPVERGQVLFEVAPLTDFRIILNVDERDIAYVNAGQRGELAVSSMPGDRFPFTVNKVTPVNVAHDGRNVFRVEAGLEGEAGRLRPGMEGVGKIYVDERKLVWIWTRQMVDWMRLWAWSWLP
jgi:RND family efflux transporter MFP subunit